MRLLQNVSIQRKQMLVIMLTSTVALLLACTGFVTYEMAAFRREMTGNLSTLAQVIGNNSSGALDFNDQKAAQEMLSALRAEPNIVAACIYAKGDEPFATYRRADVSGDSAARCSSPSLHYWWRRRYQSTRRYCCRRSRSLLPPSRHPLCCTHRR